MMILKSLMTGSFAMTRPEGVAQLRKALTDGGEVVHQPYDRPLPLRPVIDAVGHDGQALDRQSDETGKIVVRRQRDPALLA